MLSESRGDEVTLSRPSAGRDAEARRSRMSLLAGRVGTGTGEVKTISFDGDGEMTSLDYSEDAYFNHYNDGDEMEIAKMVNECREASFDEVKKSGVPRYSSHQRERMSVDASDRYLLDAPSQMELEHMNGSCSSSGASVRVSLPFPEHRVTLPTQVTELEVAAIYTTLEDAEDKLAILGCDYLSSIANVKMLDYRTLDERFFGAKEDLRTMAGELIVESDNAGAQALEKIRCECIVLLKSIQEIAMELILQGSYHLLRCIVLVPHLVAKEEEEMIKQCRESERQVEIAKRDIKTYKSSVKQQSQSFKTKLHRLKGYYERLKFFYAKEDKYSGKWRTARVEQHIYNLSREERNLRKKIDKLEKERRNTAYAHDNITAFYRSYIEEIEKKKRYFQAKSWEDVDDVQSQIAMRISNLDEVKKAVRSSRERIHIMQERIMEYKRSQVALLESARKSQAATKIQKWWRRILWARKTKQKKKKRKRRGKNKSNKTKTYMKGRRIDNTALKRKQRKEKSKKKAY